MKALSKFVATAALASFGFVPSLSFGHFVGDANIFQQDAPNPSVAQQNAAPLQTAQAGGYRLRPPLPGARRPPPGAGGNGARGAGGMRDGGGPPTRKHTAIEAKPLSLNPATEQPPAASLARFQTSGSDRMVETNMIPTHLVGPFPNRGNPNSIEPQNKNFSLPTSPRVLASPNYYGLSSFGILLNGVVLEPAAAEWYLGNRNSEWRYEAMGGAIPLGLDANHAHVQPNGMYHYHGEPIGYYSLRAAAGYETPLQQIGWAFDGFPIYARLWEDHEGNVQEARSSYRLKNGNRPSDGENPGGAYDGAFTADYEFVPGHGVLDACNGMQVKTPEFPEGTYAYFLTNTYPFIPRCFVARHVDIRRR